MGKLNTDGLLQAIAQRLTSERKRLNLNQTDVCQALNLGSATLSRYENGKRSPELVDTLAFAQLGYDMFYVLTGERIGVVSSDLSNDEIAWLELYRQLSDADKKRCITMVKSLT